MIKLKKPVIKNSVLTYQQVLDFIKLDFDPTKEVHESYLVKQQTMLGRLLFLQENKDIFNFFIENLKNTKMKAYYKAFNDFKNLMQDYFEGSLISLREIASKLEEEDTVMSFGNVDATLFHFKKFRYMFISFLTNRKIENLYHCLTRLNNLDAEYNITDNLENDYEINMLKVIQKNKTAIINLTYKVFPEESKALKVLYGK